MVGNVEPEELATLPAAAALLFTDGTATARRRSATFNASSCRWMSICPGAPLELVRGCSGAERS